MWQLFDVPFIQVKTNKFDTLGEKPEQVHGGSTDNAIVKEKRTNKMIYKSTNLV